MSENDKFETLGDAYAKYPQSTLVMRKQYVDELNARIVQLEAEKLECEEYNVRADDVLCEVLEKLGFKALVERIKQKKCPYCHGKEELDAGFHANAVIGKDKSGNPSICVETLEQTFYIPIKLCPKCCRKLEE